MRPVRPSTLRARSTALPVLAALWLLSLLAMHGPGPVPPSAHVGAMSSEAHHHSPVQVAAADSAGRVLANGAVPGHARHGHHGCVADSSRQHLLTGAVGTVVSTEVRLTVLPSAPGLATRARDGPAPPDLDDLCVSRT